MKRRRNKESTLPDKANKILNGILVVLMLVAIKVWHLSVIQHEKKMEEARKPQRRVVIERCERATIYDRFNIPLAINKVQYNAAVSYGPIRHLPRWKWSQDERGKRRKVNYRKEYIAQLADKLADELHLDPIWIEDIIHSKAAILGNIPCVIQENISEESYFRLKALETEWPGIHAEVASRRSYPLGPITGEVVGYIGPISRNEYNAITREMGGLREILAAYEDEEKELTHDYSDYEKIRLRLEELEKKAYRINDFVGKMGVEAAYDEVLRGTSGKQIYLADIHGNFLQKLPGSEDPIPGSRLVLTLSSELQAFAQQLLAEYESGEANSTAAIKRKSFIPENQPWIKGGAIVALDPKTGEVYALASSPSFDPNDFIRSEHDSDAEEKNRRVCRWLEQESYLAQLWNMKVPYERPRFWGNYYDETLELTWNNYLKFILPNTSPVMEVLKKKCKLQDALHIQHCVSKLLGLFDNPTYPLSATQIFNAVYTEKPLVTEAITTLKERDFLQKRVEEAKEDILHIKKELDPYFSHLPLNYEKLLLIDLYRLTLDSDRFTPLLAHLLGEMSISEYHEASARFSSVVEALRQLTLDLFLEQDFKVWRETSFKEYLAEKREEEKRANKKYVRPYIEYLDQAKKELFDLFWTNNQHHLLILFLTGSPLSIPPLNHYQESLKQWFQELHAGAHQGLEWVYHYHQLLKITDEMSLQILSEFLQTLRSFGDLNRPLLGKYSGLRGNREKDLAMAFYPAYGFGFSRSHAFRQAATIGSIFKLVPAYEALKQRYVKLKERGDSLAHLNPLTIIDDKHRVWGKNEQWNVGFTNEGRPIPMFYRGGRLPRSEHAGIGHVDLIRALEASSNPYFAMLAGDILEDPEDLCIAANLLGYGEKTGINLPGEYAGRIPLDVTYNRTGLYSMSIGQHSLVGTPLQTAVMLGAVANGGAVLKPQIVKQQITPHGCIEETPSVRWRVFMPKPIQHLLLTGLKQVVMGEAGTAREIRGQYDSQLISQIIGKTSTAEVIHNISLDGSYGKMKLKHVCFGGISYETNDFSRPELIIVVYLRLGEWGREAAPLAVEMVKKWREIKKRGSGSHPLQNWH